MARAEVGDDVYCEDPTVRRLEELGAASMGKAAALFVPSGTMGNQIAVHVQSHPGSEAILEARSHIFNFELGAMAVWSGVLPRPVSTTGGLLAPEQIEAAVSPPVYYRTPSRLLCLENTLNFWSGLPMSPALSQRLAGVAHRRGLAVHLDGARIFNAATALGTTAAQLAEGCDTVMFCLSKGLAAPVGSLLAGAKDLITEARRVRKLFGGGMRQAGVLAAAGIVALQQMVDRLHEDHERAHRLAAALATMPGVTIDPDRVATNILVFRLQPVSLPDDVAPASRFVADLKDQGVLCSGFSDSEVRMVTHCDVDDRGIRAAISAAGRTLAGMYSAA